MNTENVSTLKIHKLTQDQYDRELAAGNIDPNALYLTPDEEIDLSGYATKEELSSKANSSHTHDDKYYTESEIDSKLSGKANTSHGNHVPATQTANNAKFLRNDNSWQTVTPDNIGAVASTTYNSHVGDTTKHITSAERTNWNAAKTHADSTHVTGVKGNSESSYRTGNVNITPANIGLGNVNNTSDTNKPVSTAQQAAIDAALASAKSYADSKTVAVDSSFSTSSTNPIQNKIITNWLSENVKQYQIVAVPGDSGYAYLSSNPVDAIAAAPSDSGVIYALNTGCDDQHSSVNLGTRWEFIKDIPKASTSNQGIVQLTDSTSSTSTTTAATPNSVKAAYDLANTAKSNATTAQNRANSAYTLAESKADSNHTHLYAGSSSAGGAATSAEKLINTLDIIVSGDGSTKYSFDGSSNESISVCSVYHSHDDKYYTESEIDSKLSDKANATHYHAGVYQNKDIKDVGVVWGKDTTSGNYFFRPDNISAAGDGKIILGSSSNSWYRVYCTHLGASDYPLTNIYSNSITLNENDLQTELDNKVDLESEQTINGVKTFSNGLIIGNATIEYESEENALVISFK